METTPTFLWPPYAEFATEATASMAARAPMTDLILGVKPQYYYVEVGARLDQRWLEYLPVVDNRDCNPAVSAAGTAMVLYVVDQAELMGIINSLHGLGLALMVVKRLHDYRPTNLS